MSRSTGFSQKFAAILLFVLPAPLFIQLLLSLLMLKPLKVVCLLFVLFFLYQAAFMTRKSLTGANDMRLWAMVYLGVGMLALLMMLRRPLPAALLMSGLTMFAYYLVYDLPSRRVAKKKQLDFSKLTPSQQKALEEANQAAEAIAQFADRFVNRDDDVARLAYKNAQAAKQLLQMLLENPEDIVHARRFLHVYIQRVQAILNQYERLLDFEKSAAFRLRLLNVLEEANTAFLAEQSRLLDDDSLKLDVELDVLYAQIKEENQKNNMKD